MLNGWPIPSTAARRRGTARSSCRCSVEELERGVHVPSWRMRRSRGGGTANTGLPGLVHDPSEIGRGSAVRELHPSSHAPTIPRSTSPRELGRFELRPTPSAGRRPHCPRGFSMPSTAYLVAPMASTAGPSLSLMKFGIPCTERLNTKKRLNPGAIYSWAQAVESRLLRASGH